MIERQKEAIKILNRLLRNKAQHISEDEYFVLLEFVVGDSTATTVSTPYFFPYDTLKPDDVYVRTVTTTECDNDGKSIG